MFITDYIKVNDGRNSDILNLIKLNFFSTMLPDMALFCFIVGLMVQLSGTVCQISGIVKLITAESRPF